MRASSLLHGYVESLPADEHGNVTLDTTDLIVEVHVRETALPWWTRIDNANRLACDRTPHRQTMFKPHPPSQIRGKQTK